MWKQKTVAVILIIISLFVVGQSVAARIDNPFGGGTISSLTVTDLTADNVTVNNGLALNGTPVTGSFIIDVTSTEALLVRKDSDGGDIFLVDTTNSNVQSLLLTPFTAGGSELGTEALYWEKLYAGASLSFEGATDDDFQTTFAITDPTTPDYRYLTLMFHL